MKKEAAISVGLHAAILLATLVALPAPKPFDVKPAEAIQVDISQISDKSQKMATATDAEPKAEKPAPKQTKVVKDVPPAPKVADEIKTAAQEPVAQEPAAEPPQPEPPKPQPPKPKPEPPKPKPEPVPLDPDPLKQMIVDDQQKLDEQKKLEDQKKIDEQKKIDDKKKADEKKKAEEKKKIDAKRKLDKALAEAQNQLNKIAGESTAPAKPSDQPGAPKLAEKNAQGNDAAMSAKIGDELGAMTQKCFSPPPAAVGVDIAVPIHFQLNTDGTVSGQPAPTENNSDPIYQATVRAAIAAVMQCQPYNLPADVYDQWQDNVISFVPKDKQGT